MTEKEKSYYEKRAPEYDDWYLGVGRFAERSRPGWEEELGELRSVLSSFSARSVLDVACGTGFLTRDLSGWVVGLDQSSRMLEVARERLPLAAHVQGDAFRLPFRDGSFESLLAGHFYGHLTAADRGRFLAEARRVAAQTLIVDAALRDEVQPEEWQERVLNDGSRHTVYKRYFTPEQLIAELGGGRVLHAGRWFVAALGMLKG